MFKYLNFFGKALSGLLAAALYLLSMAAAKAGAMEIAWQYYDMHGDITGSTKLIDPLNLLVPFLIMIIFGLAIWKVNKNDQEQESENDKAVYHSSH
jgi:uncharacterized membrane protein